MATTLQLARKRCAAPYCVVRSRSVTAVSSHTLNTHEHDVIVAAATAQCFSCCVALLLQLLLQLLLPLELEGAGTRRTFKLQLVAIPFWVEVALVSAKLATEQRRVVYW
jgi:hypothetical protein